MVPMKNLILLGFVLITFTVIAQTNVVTAPVVQAASGTALLLTLIPLMVPGAVAAIKFFLPKVPTFLLPILAPAIGALIDWIGSLASGGPAHPIGAALLGSAGVGLREIYSQVTQQIKGKET